MNKILLSWLSTASVTASVCGQGFMNLNFEDANIVFVSGSVADVATSNALPGWSAFSGTNEFTAVPYNNFAISFPWGLVGSNNLVIAGNFSASLEGSESIRQTGLIPSGTESLLFDASSSFLEVSLGGQTLSYTAISNALNSFGNSYTIYGANIAAFAGQIETLTFSPSPGSYGILDDIQFSTVAIPEPSTISLLCLGSGVLFYVRRRRRSWL